MVLIGLKDRQDIVKVIAYLVEIHHKNETVASVMRRFHISAEEYRMCCDLAVPAIAQGNMKGRYTAVRNANKAMRSDIEALYQQVKNDEGKAAAGVRMLHKNWCEHGQNVIYGKNEDDA